VNVRSEGHTVRQCLLPVNACTIVNTTILLLLNEMVSSSTSPILEAQLL